MKKYCQICGKEFETIPNGEGRKLCFECSPTGITPQERTSYKRKAIKKYGCYLRGNKCAHCGEEKIYLLEFHHLDPSQKENTLSQISGNNLSDIGKYFLEIQKCILLCANCHREFHYLNQNFDLKIEDYVDFNKIDFKEDTVDHSETKIIHRCPKCGKEISKKTAYCKDCRKELLKENFDFEKVLIEIANGTSLTEVAKRYNLTVTGLQKRFKTYGYPHKKRDIVEQYKEN